jgi:hypothetical protein
MDTETIDAIHQTPETSVETTEAQFTRLAIAAENKRAMSRGAVARAMAESTVLAKQDTMPEDVLKAIETLPNTRIHVSDGGGLILGEQDGKPVPLGRLVEQALLTNPALADGRSTKHIVGNANAVQAKSDMTPPQASKFISEHGLAKFEALPRTRSTEKVDLDPTKITAKQYLAMSRLERIEYQKRPDLTEAVLGAILRRK